MIMSKGDRPVAPTNHSLFIVIQRSNGQVWEPALNPHQRKERFSLALFASLEPKNERQGGQNDAQRQTTVDEELLHWVEIAGHRFPIIKF
jgi:hypothetical protein